MKQANRLIQETSPYLLQHAYNPVDWYPWGEEALEKAKREDKLILVSIGYSACHWCHVMEKESFEDLNTAQLMNTYFVCIKIDREERPDLDHFFMDALQAISGQGGWPLNMFLTPDAKPFYGGTYFPPQSIHNRISWKALLVQLHDAFLKRRTEIESQALHLLEHLEKSNASQFKKRIDLEQTSEKHFTDLHVHAIFKNIMASADREEGGFGNAPKFPQTYTIQFLLRYYLFFQNQEALDHALLSVKKMIRGGIYDQVGGGFCRYSTDARWFAPHFEKMLYDNALLITVIAEAYQITRDEELHRTIHETIDFLNSEMRSVDNGYYAALDADSEGEEGKFYTWSKEEFDETLGADAEAMAEFYNVHENGNWEHTNILYLKQSFEEWYGNKGMNKENALALIDRSRKKLLKAREKRTRPGLDDKIILGWNALLCTAISNASMAFEKTDWIKVASNTMGFLLETFYDETDQQWKHTSKNGQAKFPAFLDDLAYLVQSLISVHESTGEMKWMDSAKELLEWITLHFSDEQAVYFYFTPDFHADVPVRKIDLYDGATPSGNSIMAWNLHRMGILCNRMDWTIRAENMLKGVLDGLIRYPTSFGKWGNLLLEMSQGMKELVITGTHAVSDASAVMKNFIPNKVVLVGRYPNEEYELLKGRPVQEKTQFYICRQYACEAPVSDPLQAIRLLLTKT